MDQFWCDVCGLVAVLCLIAAVVIVAVICVERLNRR